MAAETRVYRSGGIHMIVRGGVARVVGSNGRERGTPVPAGPATAHIHADEGWSEPPEAEWPPAVARVAASEDGWDLPEYYRP